MIVDDSHFPLVILSLGREFDQASIATFERGMEKLFARREKFAIACDLRALSKAPDAIVRKQLTDLLNREDFKAKQDRYQVGSSNIVDSAPIRAALTAVFWLWRPRAPMHAASDLPEAATWAVGQLRAAGVPIDPSLDAYARSLGSSKSASGRSGI